MRIREMNTWNVTWSCCESEHGGASVGNRWHLWSRTGFGEGERGIRCTYGLSQKDVRVRQKACVVRGFNLAWNRWIDSSTAHHDIQCVLGPFFVRSSCRLRSDALRCASSSHSRPGRRHRVMTVDVPRAYVNARLTLATQR